jgi:hypothetical protein
MAARFEHTISTLTMKEIRDKYFGAQDMYDSEKIATFNLPKHNGLVKETRSFLFESPPGGASFRHVMSYGYDKVENGVKAFIKYKDEAYTNFRITPTHAITRIQHEIGGQRIESLWLYRFLNMDPNFYEMSLGRAVPSLAYHNNEIVFETNRKCQVCISYDVVTQVYNTPYEEATEIMLECEQYTGSETVTDITPSYRQKICVPGKCKIPLLFNHPIITLYAFLPQTTVDARVILDSVDYGLTLIKSDRGYYYINFGNETSINFSRVDRPELEITLSETNFNYENGASVIGIHKAVLRRMAGMAGLAFSK